MTDDPTHRQLSPRAMLGMMQAMNAFDYCARSHLARGLPWLLLAAVSSVLAFLLPAHYTELGHGWSGAPTRLADGLGNAWSARPSLITLWLALGIRLDWPPWVMLLLKNLFFALFFYLAVRQHPIRRQLATTIALCLLVPYVAAQSLALSPEQGWIAPALVLLVALLITPPRPMAITAASAGLVLISHITISLLALSVFALVICRSRSARPLLAGLLIGVLIHSAGHRLESGQWRIGSQLDGWNLLKGNNPDVSDVYPASSLDRLNARVSQWITPITNDAPSFATLDTHYRQAAWQQIIDHPLRTLNLSVLKARVFFFGITNPNNSRADHPAWRHRLEIASLIMMRLIILISLAFALWRGVVKRDGEARLLLAIAGGLALPYLIGFAYPRHAVPLMAPCVLMLLRWTHQCR
ncbi:hypothetical protein OAS86_00810 [Gammaproteobacteria bacterium]|nr:hypothetical protein [Gammaproteobacteria bacterium]